MIIFFIITIIINSIIIYKVHQRVKDLEEIIWSDDYEN